MITNIPVLATNCHNYNAFAQGKEIASGPPQRCDYWTGSNSIRETAGFFYLLLMGTACPNGTHIFSHFVHRVDKKVLAGQDMHALANALGRFELDQNAEYLQLDNN